MEWVLLKGDCANQGKDCQGGDLKFGVWLQHD